MAKLASHALPTSYGAARGMIGYDKVELSGYFRCRTMTLPPALMRQACVIPNNEHRCPVSL